MHRNIFEAFINAISTTSLKTFHYYSERRESDPDYVPNIGSDNPLDKVKWLKLTTISDNSKCDAKNYIKSTFNGNDCTVFSSRQPKHRSKLHNTM